MFLLDLSLRISADTVEDEANERKAIRAEVEALRRRIGALKRDPPDEARDAEIEELTRERQGLQGILRGLNGRNTYEFLTDEGLIPNYAFPEKGVTLRSVIWRRSERGAGEEGAYDQEVYEYERPAVSALSELSRSWRDACRESDQWRRRGRRSHRPRSARGARR